MTFDQFKKKYAKLNALLDAADEVLTDLYQELIVLLLVNLWDIFRSG